MNFLIKMNPRHRKSFKSLSGMPNMTEHGISGPLNPVSVEAKVENKSRSSEDTEEDFGLRRIARSWTSDDPSYLRNRVALSITEMKMKYSRNVSASKGEFAFLHLISCIGAHGTHRIGPGCIPFELLHILRA